MAHAANKQRGGIYGTAQQMAACPTNRKIAEWIIPSPGRQEFHPELFVRSTETLYSLSREGRGSAGPIITALTVAIVDAAETLAARSPRGRLTVPLVLILDEAANVCRWKDLPDLYSHYGSNGICMVTVLQSWSQGVDVWGQSGMNKRARDCPPTHGQPDRESGSSGGIEYDIEAGEHEQLIRGPRRGDRSHGRLPRTDQRAGRMERRRGPLGSGG